MTFQQRTKMTRLRLRGLFDRNNTMRITDGGAAESKDCIVYNNLFHQHLTGRSSDGDIAARKANHSHGNPDLSTRFEYLCGNHTTHCLDGEWRFVDQTFVPKKSAEYPQSVAAFFSFTSIRIEYTEPEVGNLRWQRAQQQAVAADAYTDIAQSRKKKRLGRRIPFR